MLPDRPRIALIEDDSVMGESIAQRLELEGWDVNWWQTGRAAVEGVQSAASFDLIVCDIRLSDMSGEIVFDELAKRLNPPPFLFITAHGDIDQAVRLMRLGAVDFLTKPFIMDDFLQRIEAGRRVRAAPPDASGRLGVSATVGKVEKLLQRYAGHDLPVLITGETGSGKEVAARLLHELSPRAAEPFTPVNCAAIPEELLESEIFGHEQGAFTGAYARHRGYAERASQGTLFLDEIGDMPRALQAKLLRLVEGAGFTRLGGEAVVPFQARIVAATHRDLSQNPRPNGFRDDLYFRLAVLPIEIPPLRRRPEDILSLMERFLESASNRTGTHIQGVSALAREAALAYDWPGNIRELRNRIDRAVALANNAWIMPSDLFPEEASATDQAPFASLSEARAAAERRQIERALEEVDGQVGKAAALLEISRTTLWEKMTRFGIIDKRRSSL